MSGISADGIGSIAAAIRGRQDGAVQISLSQQSAVFPALVTLVYSSATVDIPV